MTRVAAVLVSLAATAVLGGVTHAAQLPSAPPRCQHVTIGHVAYSECEWRNANGTVTVQNTQTTTR